MDFEIASIPPQKRNIKWINKGSSLIHYLDQSLLLANLENFYIISLPNLAESYYKTGYNNQEVIDGFLDKVFINAYYGEQRMLLLKVDGNSFNLGENINLTLDSVEGINLKDYNFNAVIDKDTIRLDCDEYITNDNLQCNTSFVFPGEYMVFSTAELVGNKRIYSNMEKIFVNMIENEMDELIQDKNALIKISHDTGGVYSTLDSLDVLLKQIDISQVELIKKHKLSALSTHNYWWIVLVFLSIEWFFRKKEGLL